MQAIWPTHSPTYSDPPRTHVLAAAALTCPSELESRLWADTPSTRYDSLCSRLNSASDCQMPLSGSDVLQEKNLSIVFGPYVTGGFTSTEIKSEGYWLAAVSAWILTAMKLRGCRAGVCSHFRSSSCWVVGMNEVLAGHFMAPSQTSATKQCFDCQRVILNFSMTGGSNRVFIWESLLF